MDDGDAVSQNNNESIEGELPQDHDDVGVPDEDEQGHGVNVPSPPLVKMESGGEKTIGMQKKKSKRKSKREMKGFYQSHICDECGSTLSTKEKLEVHKKAVHQKIRNFQCDQCPLAFFYKNQRDQHVQRVHLKVKDTGMSFRSLHNSILSLSLNIILLFWFIFTCEEY